MLHRLRWHQPLHFLLYEEPWDMEPDASQLPG